MPALKCTRLTWRDPIEAFAPLKDSPYALLMHGARKRWSYICAFPLETMEVVDRDADSVLDRLKTVQKAVGFKRPEDAPPFCGGWAGLISYEFGRQILPKLDLTPKSSGWPDIALGFYDQLISFDHKNKTMCYWKWGWRDKGARSESLLDYVFQEQPSPFAGRLSQSEPKPNFSRSDYVERVAKTVDYVHAGDCFQANISQRFEFQLTDGAHPYDLTRRLDAQSAAPFSAYLRLNDRVLASNSPERFLKVRPTQDGGLKVSTKPIKGTRPRGVTPEDDQALAEALMSSEKDNAENLMIVDLMRNDLSRVCQAGTVNVPKLAALESYANVHHLVSTVEGELKSGLGPVDLLSAAFPGGSVTGAPKIRAMQIIAEMEEEARGPYCGSLIWMTPDGWMESSILIRSTALEKGETGWRGSYRSGGGIVADSEPLEEYQETLDKARAMTKALMSRTEKGPKHIVFLGAERTLSSEVNIQDRSFLLGDGCFETLRSINQVIEGIEEHLRLLRHSLNVLHIHAVPDDLSIKQALVELVDGRDEELALRITVSRGAGGRGADVLDSQPFTLVSASPLASGRPYPPLQVVTSSIRRNETSPLSRIKSTSYADNLQARREALNAGADEAMMLNTKGRIACLSMGNIVLWSPQSGWMTPSPDEGARPGYMRHQLSAILTESGASIKDARLEVEQLSEPGLCLFGCNSLWGLRPISSIDGRRFEIREVPERVRALLV